MARPEESGFCLTRYTVTLILSTILILSVACAPKAVEQPKTVKVGVLYPMSGSLADKGKDSSSGALLAFEEVNAAGGIKSLGGARLEMVLADSKGDPATGAAETVRLAGEPGLVAIVGTYQSAVTKVATQEAERLRLPFVVSISLADVITERGFRYTFRVQPKAAFYARDEVAFLADLASMAGLKVKRVALIHENTDFGTASALAQKRALIERGFDIVAEESYVAEGVRDLSAEVRRVLAAKPDAILEVTYLRDSVLIRRALAAAGSRVPLLDLAGGTVSPEYRQELGSLAEGTLSMAEYSKYAEGGGELDRRFRARFGTDITGDSAYAYQSVLVLRDALERAGSADRARLREALAATDLPRGPAMILPAARLRFDAAGQNETARLFVVQVQDGDWKPVWPPEYAVAPVRLGKRPE